jgi:uncharacterized membrane protein YqiK
MAIATILGVIGALVLIVPLCYLLLWLAGVRIIRNNECAVVEEWWSIRGSLTDRIISLDGEAGYQPTVLRGGIHFKPWWHYKIHRIPLVTVPQGQIGYIFARDGVPLTPSQTLGRRIKEARNFQDVTGFLRNGGQRGPQRAILREGTYAINLAQFVVILEGQIHYFPIGKDDHRTFNNMAKEIKSRNGFSPVVIKGSADSIGVVTVHDGPPLTPGEIVAPQVGISTKGSGTNHNDFQGPEDFLSAGGRRGRQYQVLVDGTFFINRLFATVEFIPKTVVPVGSVGVVVSFIGREGEDSSGTEYRHGELVGRGCKGVWREPLMPGKYAFNTYAGRIFRVPTTNIVLKWKESEIGAHKYDENLAAVDMITKDAFEPSLPLSVVIHIDYQKAPRVIQRFGNIKKLVDQTLDPMVAAYFKNIGQTKTLIEIIQKRNEIQIMASEDMKRKFAHYDLELEEVLIGTPQSSTNDGRIETILVQLRDRQIAQEQIETYAKQEQAAIKERELNEARALARQQTTLTESHIDIRIQANKGQAQYERSLQDAARIKVLAEAKADQEARVGIARVLAVEEQVRAYGGPDHQVLQQVMDRFCQAVERSGVDVVPRLLIQGGGSDGGPGQGYGSTSAFEALITLLLADKAGLSMDDDRPRSPEVERIRGEVLAGLVGREGREDVPVHRTGGEADGSSGAVAGSPTQRGDHRPPPPSRPATVSGGAVEHTATRRRRAHRVVPA